MKGNRRKRVRTEAKVDSEKPLINPAGNEGEVRSPKFILRPFKTKLAKGMTLRRLEEMLREI